MISKILVAIDESASSDWAFETALAMAKPLDAELLLVHVLDAFAYDSPKQPLVSTDSFLQAINSTAQQEYEQRWQQFENRYSSLLDQKQEEAKAAGVVATCLKAKGTPERKLCEMAKTNDVDLIVVGNRDRTNPSNISSYLVHHAPCSVTVVHPKAAQPSAFRTKRTEAVAV